MSEYKSVKTQTLKMFGKSKFIASSHMTTTDYFTVKTTRIVTTHSQIPHKKVVLVSYNDNIPATV